MQSLSTRAMLSDLSISVWSGRKYDRKVSDEVATSHNATQDAGRYNKRLVAKQALQKIAQVQRDAFSSYYKKSMPWADSGLRIFPASLYLDFVDEVKQLERKFDAAVDEFASAYPQVIEDAKRDLNGLFNAGDYPSPKHIKKHFAFSVTMMPLPDVSDFRVDLSDATVAQLQADWQRGQDAMVNAMLNDALKRITDVVGRMSERLHAYKVTDDKTEGVFRDTLVSNVRELSAILPALNVSQDAKLDGIIAAMGALTKHDASTLREDDVTRATVATAADEILESVSEFFA